MKPLRPYKIDVFNMAGQANVGSFCSNQVPREGELILFGGDLPQNDPFRSQYIWRVETVMWQVAHRGSITAREIARQAEGFDSEAYCTWVEILVWPASGPHFHERPAWAPKDDEDDEDEKADVS